MVTVLSMRKMNLLNSSERNNGENLSHFYNNEIHQQESQDSKDALPELIKCASFQSLKSPKVWGLFHLNYWLTGVDHSNFLFSSSLLITFVEFILLRWPFIQLPAAKALRKQGTKHCSWTDFYENMYNPVKSHRTSNRHFSTFYGCCIYIQFTMVKMI